MRKTALVITFISAQALAQEAPLRMSESLAVIPPEAVQQVLKTGEVAVKESDMEEIVAKYKQMHDEKLQAEYEKKMLQRELNETKRKMCL